MAASSRPGSLRAEAVADVWLKWKRKGLLDAAERDGYVVVAVRNRERDRLREERRAPLPQSPDVFDAAYVPPQTDPREALYVKQLLRGIAAEREQFVTAIALRAHEGLSCEEIADALNVKPATVRQWFSRDIHALLERRGLLTA